MQVYSSLSGEMIRRRHFTAYRDAANRASERLFIGRGSCLLLAARNLIRAGGKLSSSLSLVGCCNKSLPCCWQGEILPERMDGSNGSGGSDGSGGGGGGGGNTHQLVALIIFPLSSSSSLSFLKLTLCGLLDGLSKRAFLANNNHLLLRCA